MIRPMSEAVLPRASYGACCHAQAADGTPSDMSECLLHMAGAFFRVGYFAAFHAADIVFAQNGSGRTRFHAQTTVSAPGFHRRGVAGKLRVGEDGRQTHPGTVFR